MPYACEYLSSFRYSRHDKPLRALPGNILLHLAVILTVNDTGESA